MLLTAGAALLLERRLAGGHIRQQQTQTGDRKVNLFQDWRGCRRRALLRHVGVVNSYALLHTFLCETLQVPAAGCVYWRPTHPAVHMGTGRRRPEPRLARTIVQNQE
jgi:hypothetical protein